MALRTLILAMALAVTPGGKDGGTRADHTGGAPSPSSRNEAKAAVSARKVEPTPAAATAQGAEKSAAAARKVEPTPAAATAQGAEKSAAAAHKGMSTSGTAAAQGAQKSAVPSPKDGNSPGGATAQGAEKSARPARKDAPAAGTRPDARSAAQQEVLARGDRALSEGRYAQAEADFRAVLAEAPKDVIALNGLGGTLTKQGRLAEAVAALRTAVEVDPSFRFAQFNLGYAARKSGQLEVAAQAYEKYTQLEPADPDGYFGLAETYRELGRSEKAVHAYEQFIKKETRSSEQRWVERAKAQVAALGGPSKAPRTVESPDAAIRSQEPSPTSRLIAEADRLLLERRHPEAVRTLQAAVDEDPSHVEARFKLGNAYALVGELRAALNEWEQVLAATSDPRVRKNAQENIARAQQKLTLDGGTWGARDGGSVSPREKARKAYDEGIERLRSKDARAAMRALDTAIALEPGWALAFIARGQAKLGLKRPAEALKDFQEAVRLDRTLAAPLWGLAEAHRATGQRAEARRFYQAYATSNAPDVEPDRQRDAEQKARQLE